MLCPVHCDVRIRTQASTRSPWTNSTKGSEWMYGLTGGQEGPRGLTQEKLNSAAAKAPNVKQWSEVKWSEVTQSCPTLWDSMDCSPPGSSVHGIFQARVLEWVVISFSTEDPPDSKTRSWSLGDLDRTHVSRTVGRRFTVWATNWHGKEDTKPLITFLKRLLIWPCESP